MRYGELLIATLVLFSGGQAYAAQKEVRYADVPGWVIPVPTPTDQPTPADAPLRITYLDYQIHLGPAGDEIFNSYRLKILRPEALSAGNISVAWIPDGGDATVHYLRIIRDSKAIDILKSTRFQILQREGSLEQAVLNGELTAALQVPGVQVGDELEFAATVRRKDPTLGDHSFGFAQLPVAGLPGAYRIRLVWPKIRNVNWRATNDVPKLSTTALDGNAEIRYELRDPGSLVTADGAPARVNVRRLIEYSDFDSWADVSHRMWLLFDNTSTLKRESPIRREIARIAEADTDPVKRAEAALRLVQDRIRYVYIGLNGGNYRPATPDETWERRFGDCKAKTALLLAVLRELGIPGEAVLVNSGVGDGFDERLPTPALFDHVIVRARMGDASYWLDGSRLGDRDLKSIPPPTFRWALPLRGDRGELERVPTRPPTVANTISVFDLDASRGFDQKAKIKVQQVFRGDSALALRSRILPLSAGDADRALKAFWRQANAWIEPESVSWRFDEVQATLLLSLTGEGKLDWTGDDSEGRSLTILGAGFTPPDEFKRPKDQDQTAPWTTDYPGYRCWVTAIHLPAATAKWNWDYYSDPMNTRLGGVDYWRASDMREGVMRTVMSRRAVVPEISTAQAQEVNARLPKFNNNMSRVYQIASKDAGASHERTSSPPFQADTDWTSPSAPCGDPVKTAMYERKSAGLQLTDSELQLELAKEGATSDDFITRGNALLDQGKYDEAIAIFNQALAINPKSALALADRGISYAWKHDIARARADLDTAYAVDPRNIVVFRGRGLLAMNEQRLDDAIAAFTSALQLTPNDRFSLQNRGESYFRAHRYANALADATKGIAQDPRWTGMYLLRARAYQQQGSDDKAVGEAKALLALSPKSEDDYLTAASIYALILRPQEALRVVNLAMEMAPTERVYLARAMYRPWSDMTGKRDDLMQTLKLNPKQSYALSMLAGLQAMAGETAPAIVSLNAAIEIDGETTQLLAMRGQIYAKAHQPALAEADLVAAGSRATSPMDLNNICWQLATMGIRLPEALGFCDAAIARAPDQAQFRDSRALVLLQLQRYDDAIAAYDAALRLRPTLATSLFGRGLARRRKGDTTAGDADLHAALGIDSMVEQRFSSFGVMR